MITVRTMKPKDLDAVMEVELRSFSAPWSREAFEQELSENILAHYYVLEEDGRVIGYMGLWEIIGEGHITNVAIHPDCRRRGLGALLLGEVMEAERLRGVEDFTLEVRVSNAAAIHLYEKFGFTVAGKRTGYYPDTGEDALLMWRRKS